MFSDVTEYLRNGTRYRQFQGTYTRAVLKGVVPKDLECIALRCGDQRRRTGCGSALEALRDDALYKYVYLTLLPVPETSQLEFGESNVYVDSCKHYRNPPVVLYAYVYANNKNQYAKFMRLLRESIMRSGRFTASECLIHSIFIQREAIK